MMQTCYNYSTKSGYHRDCPLFPSATGETSASHSLTRWIQSRDHVHNLRKCNYCLEVLLKSNQIYKGKLHWDLRVKTSQMLWLQPISPSATPCLFHQKQTFSTRPEAIKQPFAGNATRKLNLTGFKDSRAAYVWSIIMSFQLILKTFTREDASIWILDSRNLYNIYCFPHFKVAPLWNPKTHLGSDQTESIKLSQKPITRRYTSGGNCQNLVLSQAKLVSY